MSFLVRTRMFWEFNYFLNFGTLYILHIYSMLKLDGFRTFRPFFFLNVWSLLDVPIYNWILKRALHDEICLETCLQTGLSVFLSPPCQHETERPVSRHVSRQVSSCRARFSLWKHDYLMDKWFLQIRTSLKYFCYLYVNNFYCMIIAILSAVNYRYINFESTLVDNKMLSILKFHNQLHNLNIQKQKNHFFNIF